MQRTMLRLPRRVSRRTIPTRCLSTTARHSSQTSPFDSSPAPPRLPKEEQEIFERLQRQSTGAFSTPRSEPSTDIRARINQSPDSASSSSSSSADIRMRINLSPDSSSASENTEVNVQAGARIPEGEEVHPNLRKGAPPEFEGEVNPRTGEVGGPKNEPLRWGAGSDWSYNGRVTDF
ncbi:hypothetical protein BU26DRAFT_31237 [Trematosphaeria pertusa]|uniref:Succinate dehydrogenase assembly factor 4, mitochondrial n=1 Tax=Trematosphaeria pertusa TaxID=390896 RepID=A0A6A6J3U4_9PLEO|nr:uncharacterized protein BU26DRAFT_31237 [Trematosphaeria pertusa]KAF2256882.1 hypothetical protein BU26DRAFT_31237 [Trematosphaeria pertusa]